MAELKLVSPIPPSVNHYLAYRTVNRGGKTLAMSYKTAEAKAYQRDFMQYVAGECDRQGWTGVPDPAQHFYVDAVFYFPQVDLDANNYFKVMLDAITDTGRVWADDNVVCERVQAIYYTSRDPRIEIVIHPVDYIGIFKDRAHLDEFESGCVGCRRYARNCSILRKAKEGRIQDEIRDGACLCRQETKGNTRRNQDGKDQEDTDQCV